MSDNIWFLERGAIDGPWDTLEPYTDRAVALVDFKTEVHDLHETDGLVYSETNSAGEMEVRTDNEYVRLFKKTPRTVPGSREASEQDKQDEPTGQIFIASDEILARLGL